MNVAFCCPMCDQTTLQPVTPETDNVQCQSCQHTMATRLDVVEWQGDEVDRMTGCILCPSDELYIRKNFSQRIGITIIAIGFLASTIAWAQHRIVLTYAILFASALIDVLLFFLLGNLLQCYRCHAEFRGVTNIEEHSGFELETHERYRQQAARLKDQQSTS